ncbi:MAG: hypothetical protein K2I96_18880 [Lachnospiraceae bacterium]|nr:hypothetical protein [Lachnospiraceae bacterium]
MKNRGKLRHIVVNDKEYLWNYYYDDMDFSNYPYSYYLFVPKRNPRLKVRVYFTKYAPQMNLDIYAGEGTVCQYQGKQIVLNLCRPVFARQMIEYVFQNCCHDTDVGEFAIKNGEAVLERLGYADFYEEFWENHSK